MQLFRRGRRKTFACAGTAVAEFTKEENKMKKVLSAILAILMLFSLTACSGGAKGGSTAKTKVNFWYLWGGDEGKTIEKIIAAYNKSQSKYQVVGLSTPDQQKVITAISGGQGPDVTDDFGSDVTQYASEKIAMSLDDLISRDKFDTTQYLPQAIAQQKSQGKTYALPLSVNVYALYYNKDLLQAAGITELPKTLEDLISLGDKTTKVENGAITQLGGPLVSGSYWPYCFTYAYGDNFGAADGSKLTPDTPGFQKALTYLAAEVQKFGKDPLNNFVSSGNSKAYTAQDPFLAGKQVFRIDGPWFYNMAKDAKVNFDLMPIPGAASKGGTGYTSIETSMMFIPSTSKNKDGAWDFLKYITSGDGSKLYVTLKGDLPSTKKLSEDSSIINLTASNKVFLNIVAQNHMSSMPASTVSSQYSKALSNAINAVQLGGSVSDAMNTLKTTTASLSKQ